MSSIPTIKIPGYIKGTHIARIAGITPQYLYQILSKKKPGTPEVIHRINKAIKELKAA